jgi:hypothetical protein
MKRNSFKVMVLVLSALMLLAPSYSFAKGKKAGKKFSPKTCELKLALRDLWTGHIFWVRNVVLTTKQGEKEAAKVAEEQVVQNAKELANSITPYYGKEASAKLFNLLAGHYGAIKDYMSAAYGGDKKAENLAADKLKKNAEVIAAFLSSANPNWPKETVLSLLVEHGGHHMAQIDAINAKNYSSEAQTWDAMKENVYVIADALADGIVKQFPKKF